MDDRELSPPSNFTVTHDHRAVLYQPDGRVLVRAAGFVPQDRMALQNSGQFPQLNTKPTKKTGKGGKKGGGRRGC